MLKIFNNEKVVEVGGGYRHNLKTKLCCSPSTLRLDPEQSGKCSGSQIHSLEGHVLPEHRSYLLSTTLNVLNKLSFENFPKTFQNYSGRTQLPFLAYTPSVSTNHPSSLFPLQEPLLPVPNYCVEQFSHQNSSWVAAECLGFSGLFSWVSPWMSDVRILAFAFLGGWGRYRV